MMKSREDKTWQKNQWLLNKKDNQSLALDIIIDVKYVEDHMLTWENMEYAVYVLET
mgnify:CR=1 FL=1